MQKIATDIAGAYIIEPKVFGDERGFFMETYSQADFAEQGITTVFVQDNHSKSRAGVLRGLHYQLGREQAKLVRVIAGAVLDVAVDIRVGSPTFGLWVGIELSAENKRQLLLPEGLAHGFYTLAENTEFLYKCSDFYAPETEHTILWNDSDLNIDWKIRNPESLILSAKDRAGVRLRDMPEGELPVYKA